MKRAIGLGLAAILITMAAAVSAQGLDGGKKAAAVGERSTALQAFDAKRAGLLSRLTTVKSSPLQLQSLVGPALFDGKRIRRALALQLAGDRDLLDWGNCSYRIRENGTPVSLFSPTKLTSAKTYACVYLGFAAGDTYEEYYLTDQPCEESPAQFCFGAYLIGAKLVSTIRKNTDPDADKHIEIDTVIRAKVYPSGAPSDIAMGGADRRRTGPQTSLRWDAVYRVEQWHRFSAYSHHWGYTIKDRNGSVVDGPVEDATYFPVAHSSSGGSRACSTIGGGVTAVGAGVTAVVAGLVIATGTGVGAVAGGVAGSPIGPEGTLGGAGLGGTLGAGFAALPAGVATGVGGVASWAAGTAAEAICDAVTTPPANPPSPPVMPGLPPHLIDRLIQFQETSCMRCDSFGENSYSTAHWDDQNGEIVVTNHSEVACSQWTVVMDGEDANGDGFCD